MGTSPPISISQHTLTYLEQRLNSSKMHKSKPRKGENQVQRLQPITHDCSQPRGLLPLGALSCPQCQKKIKKKRKTKAKRLQHIKNDHLQPRGLLPLGALSRSN